MKHKKPEINGREIFKIEGSLCISEMSGLKRKLLNHLKKNDTLELDIKNVMECDTAGIQFLHSVMRSARERGNKLNILGKSKPVEDALSRAGMNLGMIIH
jgi:ABC-type transporter Mla MlaB component